ncbi:hypothetical protein NG895_20505 [Aeoliella sp. ICT_H6.2]|uniref:Uncharacterized protein n=1 Tax=Aeoliella straminimaris TaxID=2954799 RepID=A0A9X2JI88_9BACT|nr:hypothetical protein [Aeoliella straminimaris]MCO6046287.1 hypothetical protein [Aeoliella straminimaris]
MNETTAESAAQQGHSPMEHSQHSDMQPVPDLVDYLHEYARQKPQVVALWCLGVGFVLGWKLKPW